MNLRTLTSLVIPSALLMVASSVGAAPAVGTASPTPTVKTPASRSAV